MGVLTAGVFNEGDNYLSVGLVANESYYKPILTSPEVQYSEFLTVNLPCIT